MKILKLKLSRCLISLIGVVVVTWLFAPAFDLSGVGWAQTTIIEAKFDTPGAIEVISGDFFSNLLPTTSAPAVDAQIQAFLQSGGFQFTPLGWSLSGETRGCQNGIIFGNLYLTTDPILTAALGADSIIFIPVGMRCGTGVGDIPFDEGQAILIVTIGPQVPAGYFAPVEVVMWSGADTAIAAGVNGMLLRLDLVP